LRRPVKRTPIGDGTFIAKELLGRPTDHSVTVNVVPQITLEIFYQYGIEPGAYTAHTDMTRYKAGTPAEVVIDGLKPDTRYFYRICYRSPGETGYKTCGEHSFYTQRTKGSTFIFTVQADSHLGTPNHCNPELYKQTLQNAIKDVPDFHIRPIQKSLPSQHRRALRPIHDVQIQT